jgi:hypothetical protein
VSQAPRISGRAEQARLGGRGQTHLRRVGLAEDRQPGAAQARRDLAVVIHHEIPEERAPEAGHGARVVRAEILQEKGHAGERTIRQAGSDGGARLIVELGDHGVERGVHRLQPRDGELEQLARTDLALSHQLRQVEPVEAVELLRFHPRLLSCRACEFQSPYAGVAAAPCAAKIER